MDRIGKEDFIRHLGQKGVATSAMIEITTRCNLKCKFCYIGHDVYNQKDIPKNKLYNIIDQLAEMGCMDIVLLGGEPFIRKDFIQIYNYIASKGIFIHIYSNGTLLRKDVLKRMRAYPYHTLRISLYGASPQTYKELTGNANAFKQVISGIRKAQKIGVNFWIRSLLNKINQKDYLEMEKIARKFRILYGIQKRLHAKTDGSMQHYSLSLIRGGRKMRCEGCIYIDNQGRLTPCPVIRKPAYNLGYIPLKRAWKDRLKNRVCIKCPTA